VAHDWQAYYGHPVVLLETFVERDVLLPQACGGSKKRANSARL
jgi:hypothetical protein